MVGRQEKDTEVYGQPEKLDQGRGKKAFDHSKLNNFNEELYPLLPRPLKVLGLASLGSIAAGAFILAIDPTPSSSIGGAPLVLGIILAIPFMAMLKTALKERRSIREEIRDVVSRSVRMQDTRGGVDLSRLSRDCDFHSEGDLHELLMELSDEGVINKDLDLR